jgi:glycosyltransferase involved in cell wall biosynthesis
MPSLHEGAGIAAMEALGSGVPALLADVEGLRDLRPFAACEWSAPDAASLSAALLRCLSRDSAALREHALQSSERIHGRFGIAHGASHFAILYRRASGAPSC